MKPATMTPVYAVLYATMAEAARSCGYALAVHGTMARDLDVVAIPWTEEATSAEQVVRAMAEAVAQRAGSDLVIGGPNRHAPHGRTGWSIPYAAADGFTTVGYVDVSVTARSAPPEAPASAPSPALVLAEGETIAVSCARCGGAFRVGILSHPCMKTSAPASFPTNPDPEVKP